MNSMWRLLSGARRIIAGGGGPIQRLVASSVWTSLAVASLILFGALFYIWQRVRVLELVEQVSALENVNRGYQDLLMKSEAEVAELSRIGRITAYAADSLGMGPVALDNLFTVTIPEDAVGLGGAQQVWASLSRPFKSLPRIESNEASAHDLFDAPR